MFFKFREPRIQIYANRFSKGSLAGHCPTSREQNLPRAYLHGLVFETDFGRWRLRVSYS
jgi:hypothetical protein